jgi:hypothetical protein
VGLSDAGGAGRGEERIEAGGLGEDRPAFAGLGLALACVSALAGLRSGFSQFRLFGEILLELFVDLGGNGEEKSSILREIIGIGARNFMAM